MLVGEWYDDSADFTRTFLISYYTKDNTLEMYDVKQRRIFLKRIHIPGVGVRDLYVGNVINIYSRNIKLVSYGDEFTRERLQCHGERTFAMIKPDAVLHSGSIIKLIMEAGFVICNANMVQLTKDQAMWFYQEHEGRPFFNALVTYITNDRVLALELVGENAVRVWRETLGPTDSDIARIEAPHSVRAKWGKDKTYNAAHGSDSSTSAERELDFFFPLQDKKIEDVTRVSSPRSVASLANCTCCIIKPHAVQAGLSGRILHKIEDAGFILSGVRMLHFNKKQAEEFLEVYRGVIPEYTGVVSELASGLCFVLEVSSSEHGDDTVQVLRDLVGPADPEIGKQIRPSSLRAQFGVDKVQNAIHCSDLNEDGALEVEYCFKLLQ